MHRDAQHGVHQLTYYHSTSSPNSTQHLSTNTPPLPTPSTEGPEVTSLPLYHYYIHLLREHSSSMESYT